MTATASPPRSTLLLPREHGAWGQVCLPLAAALASGAPRWPAALLALAVVGLFLGHEALLVLLGQRGPRVRARKRQQARWTLGWLVPATVLAGVAGLVLAPTTARLAGVAILPAALILGHVITSGREKTTPGEAFAGSTAAGLAVPVAIASGIALRDALIAWLAWTLAFGAATGGVRWLLARHTHRSDPTAPLLLVACTLLTAGVAVRIPLQLAALPQIAIAWTLATGLPRARQLRWVGWSLMAASVVTATALVAGTR